MSLKSLHAHLGRLLTAGVNPDLPVVSIADGWPCEVADIQCLEGNYKGDPSPKMPAYVSREGAMIVLVPITEDTSDLINDGSHRNIELPVDTPSPI